MLNFTKIDYLTEEQKLKEKWHKLIFLRFAIVQIFRVEKWEIRDFYHLVRKEEEEFFSHFNEAYLWELKKLKRQTFRGHASRVFEKMSNHTKKAKSILIFKIFSIKRKNRMQSFIKTFSRDYNYSFITAATAICKTKSVTTACFWMQMWCEDMTSRKKNTCRDFCWVVCSFDLP